MTITIVGWYGTETIGDRGILAGIFSMFKNIGLDTKIELGSLYPFLSERTLIEDLPFFEKMGISPEQINVFNSKKRSELDAAINRSEWVVIGGGPLMHIHPIFMLEYAFKKAKSQGKRTIALGCGIGPLHKKMHAKAVTNILKNSDLSILRDQNSLDYIRKFNPSQEAIIGVDPSIEILVKYIGKLNAEPSRDQVVINVRSFPEEYSKTKRKGGVNGLIQEWIASTSQGNPDQLFHLIPMHYFEVGDDDRKIMNDIALSGDFKNLSVQQRPLSLEETMFAFWNAKQCVGMRFHSVVFQTILSKNNVILDYTEPNLGKIGGFIGSLEKQDGANLSQRYINLQNMEGDFPSLGSNHSPAIQTQVLENHLLAMENLMRKI